MVVYTATLGPEKVDPETEWALFMELLNDEKSVTVAAMPQRVVVFVTHGVVQSQWSA
jgi:hypothetical protein